MDKEKKKKRYFEIIQSQKRKSDTSLKEHDFQIEKARKDRVFNNLFDRVMDESAQNLSLAFSKPYTYKIPEEARLAKETYEALNKSLIERPRIFGLLSWL